MTVAELIEVLKTYPQNAVIMGYSCMEAGDWSHTEPTLAYMKIDRFGHAISDELTPDHPDAAPVVQF